MYWWIWWRCNEDRPARAAPHYTCWLCTGEKILQVCDIISCANVPELFFLFSFLVLRVKPPDDIAPFSIICGVRFVVKS